MRCCGWRAPIARRRSRDSTSSFRARAASANLQSRAETSRDSGSTRSARPGMTGLCPIGSLLHEPSSSAQRPPRGRKAGPRRADRRRQIRLDVPVAGAAYAGARGAGDRRSRSGPRARSLPHRRLGRRADRSDHIHRRWRQGDVRRDRGDRGGDRQSRRRHQACARRDRGRQAYRHGQCRGRRAGGTAARRGSAQRRRGLFAGLWRPAGADRRDGGLGARHGISRRRRRQGHEISAGLS